MEIIRQFENNLGTAQVIKHDDTFTVKVKSDFAKVSNLTQHQYKQDAIAQYQFYTYWLTANERHVI